jgi:hypothetical protein
MNTAVKIKSCTGASASGKNQYNLERQKNQDKDILVLENNGMPKEKATLSLEQKKEIKSLQTKLSVYKKRLAKAIENGKEKSIKTNQKNIDKISQALSKIEKPDKRQKHFTEFTIALTNSHDESFAANWSKLALDHIKQEFPTLEVVSAVEHLDQHSPHMHILLHSPNKPITQVLAEQSDKSNTKRESMKEAYSDIAHKFHSFANDKIAHKELEPLQKGRKYVSLGQYKHKGNFELKKLVREQKETLPALETQNKQLSDTIQDANIFLKAQNISEHSLEVHTSKGLFVNKPFVTYSDLNRKKEILQDYADNAGKLLDTDVTSVKNKIDSYFNALENHSKKGKEKQQPHFPKEPVLKIDLAYFKNWKEAFNKYLSSVDANIKKMILKITDKKISNQEKIYNHPEMIKRKKEESIEKSKSIEKFKRERELKSRKKERGYER